MSNPRETLLIRADASVAVGAGHAMRCLALAQGWIRAGRAVTFAMAESLPAIAVRMEREGIDLRLIEVEAGTPEDAQETARLAEEMGAFWVVADGYRFDAIWQNALLAGTSARLAVLDDYGHSDGYVADLIVNQNLSAQPHWYARKPAETRLALGPTYALLRQEFTERIGLTKEIPQMATKILVTLGGTDAENITARVISQIRLLPGIHVRVVLGGGNPHRASIEAIAREANGSQPQPWLEVVVDAVDMPELMAWADVAVTAGGSTLWETAFMGLPVLALTVADNQVEATRVLAATGAIRLLASPLDVARELAALLPDFARRQAMQIAARELVDGRGVVRVIEHLEAA